MSPRKQTTLETKIADFGIIILRRSYLIHWYQLLHPHIVGSMPFLFWGATLCIWFVVLLCLLKKCPVSLFMYCKSLQILKLFIVFLHSCFITSSCSSPRQWDFYTLWFLNLKGRISSWARGCFSNKIIQRLNWEATIRVDAYDNHNQMKIKLVWENSV